MFHGGGGERRDMMACGVFPVHLDLTYHCNKLESPLRSDSCFFLRLFLLRLSSHMVSYEQLSENLMPPRRLLHHKKTLGNHVPIL
ncbi:hypothetical protein CFIMG_000360RA [Ceratocystis fimbriata CBS 114723]|uniref:Uncharacterized protein n=1 Tax=Ceratocystis fimbriata CBS 114723 TaxID=1035309 RepID=A0A2C5XL67_9PEZI|nr:hypothetical protein CFIMG_000360RA [Ceratocystis fimbriata CBS 114723]